MNHQQVLSRCLQRALSGEGAHVNTPIVLEALDWQKAGHRPEGWPHSAFEILKHLIYWQDFFLHWLDEGRKPASPETAAEGWPENVRPFNEHEWKQTVSFYLRGWEKLKEYAVCGDLLQEVGSSSGLEVLCAAATHNSYHLGQIVQLRRVLGVWPPPSGGDTW